MTKVICFASCENSVDGVCSLERIELDCEGCASYEAYPDENNPDYQEEYWIAMRQYPGGEPIVVRQKKKGKKIELKGLTFFTQDDVRYGYHYAVLTEKETGYKIDGSDLFNYKGELNEANFARLEEEIKKKPKVMDLPIDSTESEG